MASSWRASGARVGRPVYDAGSVWHEGPLVPALWMYQLFLEGVPKLDATVLRRHWEQRTPAEQMLPETPETEKR